MLASPGVMPSLVVAILALTQPGDGIVIQPPVYYPFAQRIRSNNRRVLENSLALSGTRWDMDLDGLERLIDAGTRMIVLCSPHNPVGRVWDRQTLVRLAGICARRGVTIVSDEIHADLVMPGFRHIPIASVSEEAAGITVTLMSATKTFNLAGMGGSITVISDPGLRSRVEAVQRAIFGGTPNAVAVAATEAAWRHGGSWLDQLLAYLDGNYRFLDRSLAEKLPPVTVFPLEGTYLPLLDMRRLGMPQKAVRERLLGSARVWLEEGTIFGREAEGFQRMNIASPRSVLAEAVDRITAAFSRAR
jgi:cystathionine beta-lyase